MSDQPATGVSADARAIMLSNEIAELKRKKASQRPGLWILVALVAAGVSLFVPVLLAPTCWLGALVSVVFVFVAMSRGNSINSQITDKEQRLRQLESADSADTVGAASVPSVTDRLASLKSMLDQGLVTQEEFDTKRSELLKQI